MWSLPRSGLHRRPPAGTPAPVLPVRPADRSQTAAGFFAASAESPPLSQQAPAFAQAPSADRDWEYWDAPPQPLPAGSGPAPHRRNPSAPGPSVPRPDPDFAVRCRSPRTAPACRSGPARCQLRQSGRSYRCRPCRTLPRYIVRSRHHLTFKCQYPYYNGFFLIFANGLGYFFGVSAIFFIKITRWTTSVPGIW